MKALDPKIRRCERFGFCPFHFSNGDEVDLFDGIIFRMYVEYATVSAQRLGGNLFCLRTAFILPSPPVFCSPVRLLHSDAGCTGRSFRG